MAEEEAKDRQTEAEAHIQTAQKLQIASQELEILVQDKRARVSSQGMPCPLFLSSNMIGDQAAQASVCECAGRIWP